MNDIATALHTLLAYNIVSFTFRKVNGEIRHAKGTRNLVLAENYTSHYINRPMGEEQPNSYYDVEKMGWRSYKPENLISIDGVVARTDTDFTNKPIIPNEPPKREIPISKPMGGISGGEPMGGGADIDKILGGIFGGFGMPMGEIRKTTGDLGKDIETAPIGSKGGYGKVGTPTPTEKGIELPLGSVSADDFARLVAKYVVDELVSRIKG